MFLFLTMHEPYTSPDAPWQGLTEKRDGHTKVLPFKLAFISLNTIILS